MNQMNQNNQANQKNNQGQKGQQSSQKRDTQGPVDANKFSSDQDSSATKGPSSAGQVDDVDSEDTALNKSEIQEGRDESDSVNKERRSA